MRRRGGPGSPDSAPDAPAAAMNKFLGLIRIFNLAEATPARQWTNKFVLALGLIRIFDFVLDTPARQ